jgi:serine/threonine-protein kinase
LADIEPTFGDGRYIIRRELGRGTMGVVYEAEDALLARTVAVKTIDVAFAIGERERTDFERRFFTEARVAARLSGSSSATTSTRTPRAGVSSSSSST